jgi:ferredoxin
LSEIDERQLGTFTVRIDRHLCVGFGDCVDAAPEAFELDDEGIAVVRTGSTERDRERLIEACRICPVDAIELFDESGAKIAP